MTNGDKIDQLVKEYSCTPLEASRALNARDYQMEFSREYLERYKLEDPNILTDNARFPLWFKHLGKMNK